jgi:APA family basic amino acid/polyamine antiporter
MVILLDFVVIIVLIFYILTILGILFYEKMPNAERPYKGFCILLTCILYYSCFCYLCCFILQKNKYKWLGVLIMLLDTYLLFNKS